MKGTLTVSGQPICTFNFHVSIFSANNVNISLASRNATTHSAVMSPALANKNLMPQHNNLYKAVDHSFEIIKCFICAKVEACKQACFVFFNEMLVSFQLVYESHNKR